MKIAVVGSTNIDMVAYAKVLPDAGQTIIGDNFIMGFGGKGANQAVMAARFDAEVYLVNSIGEDVFGNSTLENLTSQNVHTDFISRVSGPSGVAPIWVDGDGENRIIVVPGANGKMTTDQVISAINQLSNLSLVIGQFEIPQEVTAAAFRQAKSVGAMTILNPAPFQEVTTNLLQYCDWIIPNETEFAGLHPAGNTPDSDEVILELANILNTNICVTLGAAGVALVVAGEVVRVAAPAAKPVDTTGAGDCFVSSFGFGLAAGLSPESAARLGTTCASLSVTRLGTQTSYPTKLEAAEILATVRAGN